ncbi:C-type lectin mannose-binding isoform [Biomphalaria glabrata]|nr:C-type lectin mannose-binding isoform-like C-type lectin mannose-binding isoform-like [Biomphalaria glabrata]
MCFSICSIYFTLSFCLLQSATSFKQFTRVIQRDIGMYPMTSSNYSRSIVECANWCLSSSPKCEAFLYDTSDSSCFLGRGLWRNNVTFSFLNYLYSTGVFYCPTDRGFNEVAINNTRLCAFVSNTTANYTTAVGICKQNNGLLMTVKTPERINLLKALMKNVRSVYIGLDDILKEGNFVWSDGTFLSQTEMAFFISGKPTPSNSAEDCVVFVAVYGANDVPCSFLQQYVCEFVP